MTKSTGKRLDYKWRAANRVPLSKQVSANTGKCNWCEKWGVTRFNQTWCCDDHEAELQRLASEELGRATTQGGSDE